MQRTQRRVAVEETASGRRQFNSDQEVETERTLPLELKL